MIKSWKGLLLPAAVVVVLSLPAPALADRSLESEYEKLLSVGLKLQPELRDEVVLAYTRFVNYKALAALDGDEFSKNRLEEMEKVPLGEMLDQAGAYRGFMLAAGLGVYDFSNRRFPILYYVSRDSIRLYRPCLEAGIRRSCRIETPIGILPEDIYVNVDFMSLPLWVAADPVDAELLVRKLTAAGDARRTINMDVSFVATSLLKSPSKWSITFKPSVKAFSMRYGTLTAGPGQGLQWHP